MYNVFINRQKAKSYPFKFLAILYCLRRGYILKGGFHDKFYFLKKGVEIKENKMGDSWYLVENFEENIDRIKLALQKRFFVKNKNGSIREENDEEFKKRIVRKYKNER